MDKATQLRNALRAFFPSTEIMFTTATVVSVQGATCTVRIDSVEVPDVRLRATKASASAYLLVTPKEGSDVLVASLSGDLRELAVIACDEIASVELSTKKVKAAIDAENGTVTAEVDSTSMKLSKNGVIFNGGELGGMVAIEKLTAKLNALKDTLNNLVTAFNSHIHTTTATTGASTTPGIISPITTQAQSAEAFSKTDYENEKVKQ
jgi:hypothetical protein